ncbi:MAG: wax ester/triacylglycerol synthase family O-acyltransferase [Actinobacteria bacterium]|nr:wax ester/triacylglycerol synthase family O-acyltransferase [Actinomycetota bacterium]
MKQLSGLDTAFLSLETAATPLHVGSAVIIDGATLPDGWGYEAVHDLIASRLDRLPPFRWKLVQVPFGIDLPYWVEDPDFDLEFHLRRSGVPKPGGPRELAEVVARIHARPLDRSRPLWELYIVEGLANGDVALVSKIHHAAIDGVSGAELLTALVDLEPLPPPTGVAVEVEGERQPGRVEMLARGGRGLVKQPFRLARTAVRTARALPGLGGLAEMAVPNVARRRVGDGGMLQRPHLQAPPTPFNGAITQHRVWAFDDLPLDTVKAVKNAAGATVNDVIMTICARALRRYLLEHDALPDRPLQAMIPISVRTDDDRDGMGNQVTALVATLATHLEDAREQLTYTSERMQVAKHSGAVPAQLLQDVTRFGAPALAARAARVATRTRWADRFRLPFNCVISNVPGPPIPLYYAGARIKALYPVSAIADGIGLNITVMSYEDRVGVGLVACRDLVPDLWDLMGMISDALDDLVAAYDVG